MENAAAHIQAFILNPWVGFAFATLVVVASYKMNATGANILLVAAWAIFVASAFRTSPIAEQAITPRLLYTALFAVVTGLIIYYVLWSSSARAWPRLSLTIGGVIMSPSHKDQTRFQLTVRVQNSGGSTTLDDWRAVLTCRGKQYNGIYLVGELPVPGSVDLGRLDEITAENPVQRFKAGFLYFLFPLQKDVITTALDQKDPTLEVQILVADQSNKTWSGKVSMAELAAQLTKNF